MPKRKRTAIRGLALWEPPAHGQDQGRLKEVASLRGQMAGRGEQGGDCQLGLLSLTLERPQGALGSPPSSGLQGLYPAKKIEETAHLFGNGASSEGTLPLLPTTGRWGWGKESQMEAAARGL